MTLGVVLALCSACIWGTGDFCGGRASTRMDAFQVLALSAASGIVMLVVFALAAGEPVRLDRSLLWSSAAGLCTAVGIVSLYSGLSIGSAATVAPIAAVTAALLPVIYGAASQGMPGAIQLTGFVMALVGIFLVAQSASAVPGSGAGIRLGLLAGVGFGSFLVLIARGSAGSVFVPLAVARGVMLLAALLVLLGRRTSVPRLTASPMALLAGLLDAGGTMFYLLAQHYVRLDIAAVLSSLYPAATVVLACVITHEPVTRTQWLGAAVCVAAVALIAA
ncbi:MAG TPA: EamA family transporter [Vicinamibacterales bacterium]|nr:EamA family transporter [Vicinamibacterales bacterium]